MGAGFEINETGMILTNWHVVENAAKWLSLLGKMAKQSKPA
jgi:S1-C subfamily serine protease